MGSQPPVGHNAFHVLQIHILGGTNHQSVFLEVASFEQDFVLGNLKMFVREVADEALQPMVLHQHAFDFCHARLIFERQRFDINNTGQRCKFGFHNRRVLIFRISSATPEQSQAGAAELPGNYEFYFTLSTR